MYVTGGHIYSFEKYTLLYSKVNTYPFQHVYSLRKMMYCPLKANEPKSRHTSLNSLSTCALFPKNTVVPISNAVLC